MPQPRGLRDTYGITKELRNDLKDVIRPLFNYAVKGNKSFVEIIPRINWESLSSENSLIMILMMLSYGLQTNKKVFEDYIKKENMQHSVSLFHFMLKGDGMKIKNRLNTGSFIGTVRTIFENDDDFEKTLNNIHKRVTKIKQKDLTEEQYAQIEALIESLIEGKNIEPKPIEEE